MEPQDFKFNLGDQLRDTITGFTGVCVSRSQWLSNCNTYGIKADGSISPRTLDEKGMPKDTQHFDEPMLEIVTPSVMKASRETGGPKRDPGQPMSHS